MHGGAITLAQAFVKQCLGLDLTEGTDEIRASSKTMEPTIAFDLGESNYSHTHNNIKVKMDVSASCTRAPPDVIICDGLIDLNLFFGIVKNFFPKRYNPKCVYYLHENQLTIPWNSNDREMQREKGNWHYGFINYANILGCAQHIWFNSEYHYHNFFASIANQLLKLQPNDWNLQMIQYPIHFKHIQCMPIPINFDKIDQILLQRKLAPKRKCCSEHIDGKLATYKPNCVRIGWNSRWECDKNPLLFYDTLTNEKPTEIFHRIYRSFREHIVQFGFADSYEDYVQFLHQCDIIVSTSDHEFFGIGFIEALYCQCIPIAPNSLVYPEHFQDKEVFTLEETELVMNNCLFNSKGDLVKKMRTLLLHFQKNNDSHISTLRNIAQVLRNDQNVTFFSNYCYRFLFFNFIYIMCVALFFCQGNCFTLHLKLKFENFSFQVRSKIFEITV
ncbi:glycosyl transferase, group 1 [Reticulomyxa filosa]|uniref:tRNA-queuosine alpha-mannosyltransferase n=1 Tax=Reticulomyxa filosa TaxID=46433 RepID=X6LAI5_RETFI|nr:glycosyl transferase, group 1 [Reticulomyxa filosa]|eukprot:ETN99032.1 glycosyl transferase, group 1 [Reticulomyxa filosa]